MFLWAVCSSLTTYNLIRHFAVCLSVPAVLKLLKMAVGMRALLDTVMQALPQVQCDSVQSPSSGRSPLSSLKEVCPVRASMCFFPLSMSLLCTREEAGRCSRRFCSEGNGWWADSGVWFIRATWSCLDLVGNVIAGSLDSNLQHQN